MPNLRKQLPYLLALAGVLAAPVRSSEPAAPDSGAMRILDNILSKEGISVDGVFRSQYLHSSIGGPGSLENYRTEESTEYTSVDFDIKARPNTATQGRLIMRMHQDWRNFFSDVGNPINTRWLSIDGKVKEMFSYSAGDFLRKYSPLTLWTPTPGVMYEPALFAVDRKEAMDDAFLDDNKRLLQGVDLAFDASLDNESQEVLKELHLDLLGSRLRNVNVNIGNGNRTTNFAEVAPAEKFLVGGNTDVSSPLGPNVGFSYLLLFDKKGSFDQSAGNPDTAAQHTVIMSGRAGFDLASLLKAKDWGLSLSGEYAHSTDDSDFIRKGRVDTVDHKQIKGAAMLARLQGNWSAGKTISIKAGVNYLKNEADYRNELAQTPAFLGQRIMNFENDSASRRTNDPRARDYTTFDAMYAHVFKFVASDQSNLYSRAPFQKNSWNSAIMTQAEMALFAAGRVDTALQLVMPFGQATPNRAGTQSDLTVDLLDGNIEAQASYAGLENVTGPKIDTVKALPITKFTQLGGGLKVEAGGLIGLSRPLTFAGSFMRSTADNGGIAADSLHPALKVTSDFVNVGAQWNFWQRFSVLGGWQQITTTLDRAGKETKRVQTHVAGGVDYKVAAGVHLLGSLGKISVDEPLFAIGGDRDFSQLQTDLFLIVHF
jgi:hypothetical protein